MSPNALKAAPRGIVVLAMMLVSSSTAVLPALPSSGGDDARPVISASAFGQLELHPNIETIGVVVSGSNLPATAELRYREGDDLIWHSAHQLLRIRDGRLVGSLFGLAPATSYSIKVLDVATEIEGSTTTQSIQLPFMPSAILHVDASASPGGNGLPEAPFLAIQDALDQAGPGTQVLVADGIYHETISFPASGTAAAWIQVKAEGSGAILDGAERLQGNVWTADASAAYVWFTTIGKPITYLGRDGNRSYRYDDLTGLRGALGHSGVTLDEGWYFEPRMSRLYVRSLDPPSNHIWQVPALDHAFDVSGRDWIWIEGLQIQFYGASKGGCGVCTLDASHVVIRKNRIHGMQLGIFVNWSGAGHKADNTRIESNEIYDPAVGAWPWKAIKGSSMEGTGIVLRGRTGAIVRDNNIHDLFNGIYTGSSAALANTELAFDVDIYDNHIHHIGDDALEPEGACINQRFRNNTVDMSYVGISLAPITVGPTWVLRSTFTNFTGRGVKWDGHSDGIVLLYHNTAWSSAPDVNGMDLISPIRNVRMRNNVIYAAGYGFAENPTGSLGIDWNNNNWYTTRLGPHFRWENAAADGTAQLCSAAGLECDGHEAMPGLADPSRGQWTLVWGSPNIDRGVIIPGVNDSYAGNAPDVGAYEFGCGYPPKVISSLRLEADPISAATVSFVVTFSVPVTGVGASDFAIAATEQTGATLMDVSGSWETYTVAVNPGGGGMIRLDVLDDDSIRDACGNPLGGEGVTNGSFFEGETYTATP